MMTAFTPVISITPTISSPLLQAVVLMALAAAVAVGAVAAVVADTLP